MRQTIKRLALSCFAAMAFVVLGMPSLAAAFTPTIQTYTIPSAHPFSTTIVQGSDGNMWFVEGGTSKIGKVTTGGVFTEYSIPGAPVGLAAGPDGNLWYTDQSTNKVGRITPAGVVTEFAIPTSSALLQRMTAGPDGNLWFSEEGVDKIGKVTTSGVVTEYTLPAGTNCLYVSAGPDGNVWYTGSGTNKVGKITPTGSITEYTIPSSGTNPKGLVLGPDGNMWVAEQTVNKIGRVTPTGSFTEYTIPTSNTEPESIAAGPDGSLWFTEYLSTSVGRITTSGAITEYAGGGTVPNVAGIAAGPDGNVWFTKYQDGQIAKLVLPAKPGITNKTVSVVSGSSVVVDVTTGVSGNPDTSTLRIVSGPSHGTAVDPPGTVTYTPAAGYVGSDSLVYEICSSDDTGVCAQATLAFTTALRAGLAAAPNTGAGTPPSAQAHAAGLWVLLPAIAFISAGVAILHSEHTRFKTIK